MKPLMNIVLVYIVLLCSANDYPKSEGGKSDLKGKIKSLTEIHFFEFHDCEFNASYVTSKYVYNFDVKGRLLSESYFRNYNDSPQINMIFSDTADSKKVRYYEGANWAKEEYFSHDDLRSVTELFYDAEGRVSSIYNTRSGIRSKGTYYYRANEKYTEIFSESDSNVVEQKIVEVTDERGNIIERRDSVMDKSGFHLRSWIKQKYDGDSNLVEYWTLSGNMDSLYKSDVRTYTRAGLLKASNTFWEWGGLRWTSTYEYDNNGRLIKLVVDDKDIVTDEEYEMLYKGTDRRQFDHSEVKKYQYQSFDNQGNYLRRIVTSDKEMASTTDRVIEYYE